MKEHHHSLSLFILTLTFLASIRHSNSQFSLFDQIEKNNDKPSLGFAIPNSNNNNNGLTPENLNQGSINSKKSNKLEMLLGSIKGKISNSYIKNNFSIDNIANLFANFVAGNQFVDNIEVKNKGILEKVTVNDELKVKTSALIKNLKLNKQMVTKVFNITDNEIIFEPDAKLNLVNSKLVILAYSIFRCLM